ncbi:DCC family protein At1g52590, chloroplastic isoform X2 [Elaeis guineensis]|uniref:DCC family protein At1g52590, chloroplastic isoform X2 n=1 Tax=Elaeis guineensis var. tenera TaxID=51953 RepID=A0A6I9QT66_ELAGV|nr:DCC family protein At1g52590, chloroplastic isoform X2 [Elaeis guineensis]XP_010914870.1 DCC family protein At1g52590, chloroplastic isoform X2 [Elaeis guineensis]
MTVIPLPARSPPVVAAGMGSNRLALRTSTARPAAKAVVDWVKVTDAEFFNNGDSRPIMLFDGVCNLCNGGVRFVRENDRQRRIRFEALQSESGRKLLQRSGRSPDDISSVVLVEKDRSYVKSEAVLKIMEYLDLPFPQLALLLKMMPLLVRDFAYDNVANNRYMIFGRSESESCEI